MRILIVTQYYYPEQFQINEIVPELVKRGHEVTVLCGVPNYPKGVPGVDGREGGACGAGAEGKESSTIGEELRKFCAEFEEIGS